MKRKRYFLIRNLGLSCLPGRGPLCSTRFNYSNATSLQGMNSQEHFCIMTGKESWYLRMEWFEICSL